MIDEIFRTVFADSDEQRAATLGRLVLDEVQRRASAGDVWAQAKEREWTERGAYDEARKWLKKERGTFNGIDVPARYAIPIRDDRGRVVEFQLALWHRMTFDQFREFVRQMQAQAAVLESRAAKFEELLALEDRFPAARTIGEACEMAGIDLTDFMEDQAQAS